jgi:Ser/Thr protein kinase RdoA (MazF antagonist)
LFKTGDAVPHSPFHRQATLWPHASLLLALIAAFSPEAHAQQDKSLATVEVVGSTPLPGIGQPRNEIAAPVQSATSADIARSGALALNGATLNHFNGFSFSVSPSRGGRRPELENLDVLEWIGRFLARIHTVGAARPFVHRPALNLQTFGHNSRQILLDGGYLPLDMESRWLKAFDEAMTVAQGVFDSVGDVRQLRLHGDCHPGNILWTPEGLPLDGPHFVDLDDARSGPAVQDLWMLLSGERAQQLQQLGALVDGYDEFGQFDRRELALIEPLRTLRLVHYSAWLAQRWHDPIFPINFPWFGSSDYWKGQVDMLVEQTEAMQAAPLLA